MWVKSTLLPAFTQKCGVRVTLRRTIVKKIISLVLALTLLVGMFSVATVAFAEDATTVTVNQDAVNSKIAADDDLKILNGFTISEGEIAVPSWLEEKDDVQALFTGINFVTEEKDGKTTIDDGSDKVLVQYFKPAGDRGAVEEGSSKANYAEAGDKITVAETGWWSFRFVVVRPRLEKAAEGEEKATYFDIDYTKDIVASSALIDVWAQDTDNPVISLREDEANKLIVNGLTAGTRKSISTTSIFNTTDNGKNGSSSYITINYIVEKIVDGKWVKIYDTTADTKVVEGYGDYISSSGILASEDEVSKNGTDYKYRVTYSFVDSYGYVGKDSEGNDYTYTLNLTVKAKEKTEETKKVDVWKIVLYVIAGLSAVGIVVLLCIQPKQPDDGTINGRVHYGSEDNAESNDEATTTSDDGANE